MTAHPFTVAGMTWRSLTRGRRPLLLLGLVGVGLLLALLLHRVTDETRPAVQVMSELGLALIVPITALLLGVNGLGNEVDDGSITYVLATPTPRWQIAAEKLLVVAGLSAALGGLTLGLMWWIMRGSTTDVMTWVAAGALSGLVHGVVFTALGTWVRHAVVVGVLYLVLWEQVIMGLAARARFLSLRHASMALAEQAHDLRRYDLTSLSPTGGAIILGIAVALGAVLAARGLSRARLSRPE